MSAIDTLRNIAADPLPKLTARQIMEARLGRKLGQINEMPRDTRAALSRLAKGLANGDAK